MLQNALEQSILRTLHYFDIADFPLTAEEVFRYLWCSSTADYQIVVETLSGLCKRGVLEQKYSYYFLPGREVVVEKRRQRLLISELKMKKARLAVKFIRSVPFLRAVFVCNSVGSEQAGFESDIDFFIITSSKRVWIVRLFSNLILRLFGLRTYGENRRNRICLSFYVDSDHLNLSSLRVADDDIHLIYWLHQMVALYDPHNYREKFKAENTWTKQYLPYIYESNENYLNLVDVGKIGNLWKKIWETMWTGSYGDIVEKQAKELQVQKMKLSIKELADKPEKGVILSDCIIKLHENDRRLDYRQKWMDSVIKTL